MKNCPVCQLPLQQLPAKMKYQNLEKKIRKRVLEKKHLLQPMAKTKSEQCLVFLIDQ